MKVQKNTKNNKRFTSKMQAKLLLVFCIILICLAALVIRLIFFKEEDGERYTKRVLSQQTYMSTQMPYKRGDILDRNNTVLATSEKVYNVIWDIKQMMSKEETYRDATVDALAQCFGFEVSELNKEIEEKPNSQYKVLLKEITYNQVNEFHAYEDKIKEANKKKPANEKQAVKGVWFEEDYVRKYPLNTVGSDFIGFTSSGNVGNGGLEEYYNEDLNGSIGREYGYFDSELNLTRNVKPPVNGNSLKLTIDANVQKIIEKHINKFDEEVNNLNTAIVIANPQNGEIYAMASSDQYDLNDPRDLSKLFTEEEIEKMSEDEQLNALNNLWRSFDVHDFYEPGSTFKPFTVAMGLEEGILTGNETYYCDGFQEVNGQRIECNKPTGHGQITLKEAIMVSCNDAMMQIVAKVGKKRFNTYQNLFGFGKKTGLDMLGESPGAVFSVDRLNPIELATSSFGQGLTVSMMQMVAGFSALINGGHYYEPHLLKEIVNENNSVVESKSPVLVKEIVSKRTSELLKDYMYATVADDLGTAKNARVKGYEIGGKTGTAQKHPRDAKKYLISFLGFTPIEDPEVVVYVIIDAPDMEGPPKSTYATGLARDVMAEILPFLGVYPSDDVDPMEPFKETQEKDTNKEEQSEGNQENSGNGSNEVNNTESNNTEKNNTENNNTNNTDTENDNTNNNNTENSNTDNNNAENNNAENNNNE